tara:strand:- start:5617 stop:6066 length:450 start_codon:yes stop_codon:yes gene_type:complete
MMKYEMKWVVVGVLGCLMIGEGLQAEDPAAASVDSEIVVKLKEIVAFRERLVESQQLRMQLGEVDSFELAVAGRTLSEARISLAKELGQQEAVIAELRELVSGQKKLLEYEIAIAEDGRRTMSEVGEIRVLLLEAEIRLLRELKLAEVE